MFITIRFYGREYQRVVGVYLTFEEAVEVGKGGDGAYVVLVRGDMVESLCTRDYNDEWDDKDIQKARDRVNTLPPISERERWAYQMLANTVEGRACTDAIKEAFRL